MTADEIKRELERLAPFHHEIDLPHGLSTGGSAPSRRPIDRLRLKDVLGRVWSPLLERSGGTLAGQRVLDAACNCGGFSIEAKRSGADEVVGVDIVPRYVEQANFLKRALGLTGVEFRQLAVEDIDGSLGTFETTFCFGLLYHLENPILGMRRLAAVTTQTLVVDTRLDPRHPAEPYWRMNFREPTTEATSSTSLWRRARSCQFAPTVRAVEALLEFLDFPRVVQIDPGGDGEGPYRPGVWATFIAQRG